MVDGDELSAVVEEGGAGVAGVGGHVGGDDGSVDDLARAVLDATAGDLSGGALHVGEQGTDFSTVADEVEAFAGHG